MRPSLQPSSPPSTTSSAATARTATPGRTPESSGASWGARARRSWNRPGQSPVTASISTSFYIEKDKPLFGLAPGILDDINLYLRFFFQSGKRYTPAVFTGFVNEQGRAEYDYDTDAPNSKIGDDWVWIDLIFENYFQ